MNNIWANPQRYENYNQFDSSFTRQHVQEYNTYQIRVITKLPNSEQSYKGKAKTHNYTNRQNQSTTGKLWKRNDPDLVQAFLKKWWAESDFKVGSACIVLVGK
jgi:hypothetical protein